MTVCNVSGGTVHRRRAAPLRGMLLGSTVLVAVAQQVAAQPAINAQPQGGRVVAGTATIGQSATLTQIDQTSQRAAINWNSFDVGSKQQVQFQQPSASAMTLNRVTGADPSQIAGQVTANGQIVLVNPAGVLFTKGAQVQAQSVVVSAAGISDQNFMAGRMVFDQPGRPDAAVVNQGRITVKQTGLAGLVAPRVENDGVISAKLGHVVLGGAQTATLDLYGDGLLAIDVTRQVTQAPVDKDGKAATALVTNTGMIRADGGTVLLTASAVDGVVQTLVTAGGNISAPSVGGRTGRIAVRGTGGAVLVTGGVLAQGGQPGTTGGQIELNTSGAVTLASTARVDASGQTGGGTIAVGTTLARAKGGPSVVGQKTAAKTTVAAGAIIAADATGKGNGGQVTVLSSDGTSMAGATTTRGGPQGGDGGNVEISANHGLTITGTVDTRAPAGKTGLLTIDPDTLTIGDNVVTANPAAPAADGSNQPATGAQTISAATFNAFTTNVSLQATGDITLGGSTPLATATTGASLTLNAGATLTVNVALDQKGAVTLSGTGGIAINAPINIGANSLDLTTGTGAGTITQTAGGAITAGTLTGDTSGVVDLSAATNSIGAVGTFTVRGNAFALNNGATPLSLAGQVYSNGTLTLNAGAVTETPTAFIFASVLQGTAPSFVLLNPTNEIQGGVRLQATAGDIRIFNSGPLLLDATTTTGNIYLATSNPEGLEINTPDVLSAPGGTVTLQSDVVVVLGKISAATFEVAPYTQGLPVNLGGALVNGELVLPNLAGVTAGTVRIGAISVPGTSGLTTTAGSIVIGGTFDASGTKLELNTTGGISGSSALTASTLSGAVKSAVDLSTAANAIGSLGAFSTGGKDFSLNNGANPLTITGPVNLGASGVLTLKAGSITEQPGGSVTAGTLTGSSSGAVDLSTANAIATLSAFTAAGDFLLGNTANQNLVVNGPLSANNITLGTSGTGTISVLGAVTTTGNNATITLTGGSGGIALNAPVGAGAGTTGTIVDLITTGGGNVTETAAGGITANQLIGNVSGSVAMSTGGSPGPSNNITALGPFTINGSGGFVLDASATFGSLTVSGPLTATAGPVEINRPNTLAVAGAVTANGAISLDDFGGGLTITGAVKGPTISLISEISGPISLSGSSAIGQSGATVALIGGEIAQDPTSAITAGTLQVSLANDVSLVGTGNAIDSLGPVTTFGLIRLTNSSNLTVSGPIHVGANFQDGVFLQSAKDITVNTPIALGGLDQVSVQAGGNLVVAAGAPISTPGSIALSAGSGGIALGDKVSGTTSVDLTTTGGGAVSQTAVGIVTTGALTGNASGAVGLGTASNVIGSLGAFTAAGDVTLNNGTTALQFTGPFAGSGTLALTAGPITQSADAAITVGTLTGASSGAVDLSAATNAIGNLGAFVTGGNLALNNGSAALRFTGAFAGSGETLTLNAGPITQTAGGAITAGTLTGSSSGAVDLGAATNAIGALGAFTPGGDFTLNNGTNALQFTGAFAGGGDTLALTAGSITQTAGGAITAGTLDGTSSGSVDLRAAGNAIATLGAFSANGIFDLLQAGPLSVIGPVTAANVILDVPGPAGGLVFSGPVTATGGLFLIAGDQGIVLDAGAALTAVSAKLGAGAGGVNEAAGASLTVESLQVSGPPIGGTVNLRQGTNAVSTLGPFQVAGGDFNLVQSRPLSVVGQVSANNIDLVASGATGGITVSAPVTAANGLVLTAGDAGVVLNGAITAPDLHIDASGTVTQPGGSLAVGTLSGSALHLAEFATNANVATLGAFTVTGSNFVLNNSGPLTIAGPLSAQYIAITALGQVTLAGTIATMGVPVAQQSGVQPAAAGSFIDVLPGASGSGRFVTTGLAAFVPLGAPSATVRIDVPGNGGLMFFDPPFAPQVFLILDTGVGGRSLGTLDVGGLLVLGTGGSATLFGTVDGFGGFGAAAVSQISPRVDTAYTFNGCAIATASCLTIQNLLQAQTAAEYRALAPPLLVPLSLLAVPQLPAPLGWLSSDDVVPPNISDVDY